jgi:hypothetical protein
MGGTPYGLRGHERDDERSNSRPPLVRAALENLRSVRLMCLGHEPEAEPKVVDLLARADGDMKRL